MARRRKRAEKEANIEGWAIPYGDLLTLLLAFFVVMYAISSVNAGKYRVLSESLNAAFGGPPRSFKPIQIGPHDLNGSHTNEIVQPFSSRSFSNLHDGSSADKPGHSAAADAPQLPLPLPMHAVNLELKRSQASLSHLTDAIVKALQPLIKKDLVQVKRSELWVAVQISSDMLFDSGSATMPQTARNVIEKTSKLLKKLPNAIRIEGYTDNVPIHTPRFPSNWELSTARAANVAHLMITDGISPDRLSLAGYGAWRPIASNATPAGRTRNRRVVIVVLADNSALRAWLKNPGRLPSSLLPIKPLVP